MAPPSTKSGIKDNYDKLLLVVGLVLMGGMLGFVVLKLMNPPEPVDTQALSRKQPKPFDPSEYVEKKVPSIDRTNTNLVLVSVERVTCINQACNKPILAASHADCPYCGVKQPDRTQRDTDKDTMLDVHETLVGLDPLDPNDAILDLDGDLIVNWKEYDAGLQEGDPLKYKMNDPKSHPPYVGYLRAIRFYRNPQQFYFSGVSKLGENKFNFQLQVRNRDRTYFKKMGEVVDKTGFRIIRYEGPEGDFSPTVNKPVVNPPKIDPSKPRPPAWLTIQEIDNQGGPVGEPIRLTKGKLEERANVTAPLIFMLDPKIRFLGADKKGVKPNDSFNIMGEAYRVLDVQKGRVVVQNVQSGVKSSIREITTEDRVKIEQIAKGTWKEPMPNEEFGLEFPEPGVGPDRDNRGNPIRRNPIRRVPSGVSSRVPPGSRAAYEDEQYRRARGLPSRNAP